jgi:hypothetical protein
MTPTLPSSPPSSVSTAFIAFDLNLAAWFIAEARLRFCGARPLRENSKSLCFLFDDPSTQGLKLQEEFNFGRATVNVMNFLNAKEMLIKLVQDAKRGGCDANSSR